MSKCGEERNFLSNYTLFFLYSTRAFGERGDINPSLCYCSLCYYPLVNTIIVEVGILSFILLDLIITSHRESKVFDFKGLGNF